MKIENRQQLLIFLVAAAAALLIGVDLIYTPLANWWSTRQKTIVALRKQVNEGNRQKKYAQDTRAKWERMRANVLPTDKSLAEQQLLKAFDSWSRDSGATLTGIMPQWKSDADDYQTLNCRVEASGNLSALTQFLYDVEKGPMALKLDSMELSSHDAGGRQLTLSLQVNGLCLNSPQKR